MNRADFQQLAEEYAVEAKTLLDAGHFGAAYYHAGYAVECGLKACICKGINQYEFPPSRDFSRECFEHDFRKLLKLAKLESVLSADQIATPNLGASWQDVVIWSEQSRYNRKGEIEARQLYRAVTDPVNGVLEWVKRYW
jgi:HEPN domain-containing protein